VVIFITCKTFVCCWSECLLSTARAEQGTRSYHNVPTARLSVRTILPGSSFVRLLMRAPAGAIYRRALAGAR
jgi:hypothetical protein